MCNGCPCSLVKNIKIKRYIYIGDRYSYKGITTVDTGYRQGKLQEIITGSNRRGIIGYNIG
jgi:hypothetical protein